jgi:hypothetical protein
MSPLRSLAKAVVLGAGGSALGRRRWAAAARRRARACGEPNIRASRLRRNVRTLRLSWEIPVSCSLILAAREDGVRLALLLDAQTPEALNLIEQTVAHATQQYMRGDSLYIQIAATLASASVAR